jgi:hypothetical protein
MIKHIVDTIVNGLIPTVKFFKNKYPDEIVVFSFPTTLSEFKGLSRIGFTRKGVLIISENSLFFKTVSVSIYSIIFVLASIIFVLTFVKTLTIPAVLLFAMILSTTSQWLPLQRYLFFSEIREAKLDLISRKRSILKSRNTYYMLGVITENKRMFFELDKSLPNETQEKLKVLLKVNPEQKAGYRLTAVSRDEKQEEEN